ncbi:unnamed protein product [Ectocarpus sp. 12 AP-2014]
MSLFLVVFLLLALSPVACRAFVACGRQEPASHGDVVGNNRGRRSRTSDAAAGFVVAGGAAAAGTTRCTTAAGGAEPRGKRNCRTTPRSAPPPLWNGSGQRDRTVAPLRAINQDTLFSANEWIAGVAGGSVGVLGTLIRLELKQEKLKTRRNCPYCDGSGKLVCAVCFSAGTFTVKLPGSDTFSTLPCPGCAGNKYITCLNCRGDGRAVPRELERKTADAAEVDLRLEEIGMGGIGQ